MRYVSCDLETTGLNPEEHSIIQFGAIIEDTSQPRLTFDEVPKFEVLLEQPLIKGEAGALAMHGEIFKELARKPEEQTKTIIPHWKLGEAFAQWLFSNGIGHQEPLILGKDIEYKSSLPIKINVSGKNFGTFDLLFLKNNPNWLKHIKVSQRIIDPAILFWNPKLDGEDNLPNLKTCKQRANIKNVEVAHTALADAWDVILLLRNRYEALWTLNR